jgi:dephospho-CoA kinase
VAGVSLAAPPPRRIGLTGGIGSGKSTAAGLLVELGATLIDTDAIARRLTAPGGAALPALVEAFGPSVLDATGALDRSAMRERVFSDAAARHRLEAVLHPLIGEEARRQAAAAPGWVLFDVPLLAESRHWRARVDRVLVIDCPEDTQVERVARRPGWTAEMARRVIAQQAPRARRRAIADAVVCNDGLPLPALAEQLRGLAHVWSLTGPHAAQGPR